LVEQGSALALQQVRWRLVRTVFMVQATAMDIELDMVDQGMPTATGTIAVARVTTIVTDIIDEKKSPERTFGLFNL
jgi:hypothetical protein